MTRQTLAIDPSARAASIQPVSDGRLWRSVAAAVLLCVVTWSGAVLFLWLAQSWLLFRLGDSRADTAAMDPSVFSESSFVTADGLRLESVLLTHGPAEERYWILFCPPAGASTRVRRIQGHLQALWRLGFNVFAFDYRGFGDNSGTPSEAGLYEDATAAYQSLTEVHGVAATHVVIAGRSLGASVAVDLATRVESGGLLLFSPIDSVPAAAARLYPWAPVRWLARYRFDNSSKAAVVIQPVVLVYGAPDPYMPLADARFLFQAFRGRRKMLETKGNHHHSGFMDLNELQDAVEKVWPARPIQKAGSR
jgi:fermentation-respiration switch protein FrsA (DUF1100 family)